MKDILTSITLLVLIIQAILSIYSIRTIEHVIEKHSVHPLFGNYKKFDSRGQKCEPWDSCK